MKASNTFIREDGTKIKLVAEDFRSPFTAKPSPTDIKYYALVSNSIDPLKETLVVQEISHDKSMGGMTREEYINGGRTGLLAILTPAEIISTGLKLKKLLTQ